MQLEALGSVGKRDPLEKRDVIDALREEPLLLLRLRGGADEAIESCGNVWPRPRRTLDAKDVWYALQFAVGRFGHCQCVGRPVTRRVGLVAVQTAALAWARPREVGIAGSKPAKGLSHIGHALMGPGVLQGVQTGSHQVKTE